MKITRKQLKRIIKEEIDRVSESFTRFVQKPWLPSDKTTPTADEDREQKVNDLLSKLVHMGVDIPDVVGLEAEQLAGAVSDAIERWKAEQQHERKDNG